MIDFSEVVNDPELGQVYQIIRSSGQFGPGGWQENKPTQIAAFGVVTPATAKQLEMLPEGDRVSEAMAFYSTQEMFVTHNDQNPGTSDVIMWQGDKYRVMQVQQWQPTANFWSAIAVRMAGE